jgi:hypothetical protein
VDEEQVPEELRQAAEDAAETSRWAVPAPVLREAVRSLAEIREAHVEALGTQASGIWSSQLSEAMRSLAEYNEVQLQALGAPVSGFFTAQLGEAVQSLAAAQGTNIGAPVSGFFSEAVRSLAAAQGANIGALGASVSVFLADQIDGTLRSSLSPILAARPYADLVNEIRVLAARPWPTYADQIALATDAGLIELAASFEVAAYGSSAPMAKFTADIEVVQAPEKPDEAAQRDAGTDPARKIGAADFSVALVWACAISMAAAQELLSPEVQQAINAYVGIIALALIVTWRINDNRKH